MLQKILVACFFIFTAMSGFGQNKDGNTTPSRDVILLDSSLQKISPDLKLKEVQIVKLEAVFMERDSKKKALKLQGMSKDEASKLYKAIDSEYQTPIENILSPAQRVEYRKHRNDSK